MFENINIPIVYKYRPKLPIEQVHRLIETGEIFFSRADSFNDPFDTALTYNFEGLNTILAEKWIQHAAKRQMPNASEMEQTKFAITRLAEIRNDPTYQRKMEKDSIEKNYRKFGICCLSAVNDDILMWAHYAQSHTGLCIGFNVNRLWMIAQQLVGSNELLELMKVTYSNSKLQINFFEAMLSDDFEHVSKFVSTKSVHWQYEKEYRLVFWHHPNSTFQFGADIVQEVIFGCKFPSPERASLIKSWGHHNPNISFFQATIDSLEFKLNIVPII